MRLDQTTKARITSPDRDLDRESVGLVRLRDTTNPLPWKLPWGQKSLVEHHQRHALRCFQRIQAPRIMTVFSPFFLSFCNFLIALHHQSPKEISWGLGIRSCRPNTKNIWHQNSRAKTQVVRICWIFSSSWSQKGQWLGCGRPLLASLSAVQHLFLMANQMKSLHFAGAHDFQTRHQGSKSNWSIKEGSICRLGGKMARCF